MKYAGIDIGLKGAIAIIDDDYDKLPVMYPLPYTKEKTLDTELFLSYLDDVDIVGIEHPIGIFNVGTSRRYTDYGEIKGLCRLNNRQIKPLQPSIWKKHFHLTKDKEQSILLVRELYPGICLLRTGKSKKPDDNLAEAVLIAYYIRKFKNEIFGNDK